MAKGYCAACVARSPRVVTERERGTAHQRGYTGKWQRYREGYLARHPLCVDPFGRHGIVKVIATVVDHITAHLGDIKLFWDPKNHQAVCKGCHDFKTATQDGGFGRRG